MANRSVSTMALPPHKYSKPKGTFWDGVKELDRFPPTFPEAEEVFEEYLNNKSMSPSRHAAVLSKSGGLMELHYDTMRKRQMDYAKRGAVRGGPSMDRSYTACAGYSGHIPGKLSDNICGASWQAISMTAHETRGKFLSPPNSGFTFTIGAISPKANRSGSLPSLRSPSGRPGTAP